MTSCPSSVAIETARTNSLFLWFSLRNRTLWNHGVWAEKRRGLPPLPILPLGWNNLNQIDFNRLNCP